MPQWRKPTFNSTTYVEGKRIRKRKRVDFSPDRQEDQVIPLQTIRSEGAEVEQLLPIEEVEGEAQQTTYAKNKERDLADWDNLRPTLLSAYLE